MRRRVQAVLEASPWALPPASQCCFKSCFNSPSLQAELTDNKTPLVFFLICFERESIHCERPFCQRRVSPLCFISSCLLLAITLVELEEGAEPQLWVVKPYPSVGEQAWRGGEQGSECVEILPLPFRPRWSCQWQIQSELQLPPRRSRTEGVENQSLWCIMKSLCAENSYSICHRWRCWQPQSELCRRRFWRKNTLSLQRLAESRHGPAEHWVCSLMAHLREVRKKSFYLTGFCSVSRFLIV